jgi:hypothetical protein
VILEEMTRRDRPWDDIHHRYYFLHDIRRVETRYFIVTMNGDVSRSIKPLTMHELQTEGNMASIDEMIPIDISKTHGIVENVFIGVDCSPEDIKEYTKLFK